MIPTVLREHVVQWYHTYLLHPGVNRTEATIQQHLYWPQMREQIQKILKECPTCQKYKKTTKKWGKLLKKKAEADPWE